MLQPILPCLSCLDVATLKAMHVPCLVAACSMLQPSLSCGCKFSICYNLLCLVAACSLYDCLVAVLLNVIATTMSDMS